MRLLPTLGLLLVGTQLAASADLLTELRDDPSAVVATMDLATGEMRRSDPARAARMHSPCSTFKIPNTVIGLDSGVISGADFTLKYDAKRNPPTGFWVKEWGQDHDLRSAMKRSVVWWYQEVARRVGAAKYPGYLARFDYGNRDISDGVDRFWLTGSLKISAEGQLAFLRKLWRGELGTSERSIAITKDVLTLEQGEGWAWRGKSGTGSIPGATPGSKRWIAWHVGGVETATGTQLYALWVEGATFEETASRRLELAKRLVGELRGVALR